MNNNMHSSLPKKEKKVTKADIDTPSNFQHNTGFDLKNQDPELKHLFDMCGISEAQLKDKETSKVIEKKGGVEAVKNELRRQGPPRWNAPPPPPSAAALIREGRQLKKVDQKERPVSTSSGRNALLDQIRMGIQLKAREEGSEPAPTAAAPSAGIVGALMEVMQKRSKAIHSSD
ncbi:hypothetical protein NHX12_020871 [Muraenolepis orangiensis]|uniref:WH2 domain-containing protein n=1 Tax=Muraenolepis orangiensis TaxID=630683 RepID=A0A9Q0EW45_9TELE|nr:hypothetical protein NHX12_020871 [Muraenolepis orangiensis]